MRIDWRLKATLPLLLAALVGLLIFVAVTVSVEARTRQMVLLVAAAGAVALCAVMVVVLAILVQRPLVELQEKIARARAGDLTVKVSFAGRQDEIGELGRDFNHMVEQLRKSRERTEELYNAHISQAAHLASIGELAAGLAHEIKNPLAGIRGAIEIIAAELPPNHPNRDVMDEVQAEVMRINRILVDLLNYARPHPPQIHRADLNRTVEHVITLARQQITSQPIEIAFAPAANLPEVEHDPTQVQQLVMNLILNGIQAIDGQGHVSVRTYPEGSHRVCIVVQDSGRGIPAEHLPNIFKPFFTTKGQGTGLGLSLAKRIVEAHGGRIEVTSKVASGSSFTICLPVAQMPSDAPSEQALRTISA
jgi:signal transduction histidine kinase